MFHLAKIAHDVSRRADYNEWRAQQEQTHMDRLAALTFPLMDAGCVVAEAKSDMFYVVHLAWDVLLQMQASGVTYLGWVPSMDANFQAHNMVAVNTCVPARELERRGAAVMLIATPALSMRDDREHFVKADCLVKAEVLVCVP